MGFRFKSQTVTLENYRQIFNVCPPDILDEIRSAILDDTAIASYIKPCGIDSYKLGQIRMAIRELIPKEYLNPRFTGRTIYLIRQGINKGFDMSAILKYANIKGLLLDAETIEKLTEYLLIGVDIDSVDFTIVPTNLIDIICKGLYQGFPMWLCIEEGVTLDEGKLHMLKRGLQLGVDIHPFLNGKWTSEQMILLFSYANQVDLNDVLSYINYNFNTDDLQVILDLASNNLPIQSLCVKDESGYPIYNHFQMFAIGEAIKDGTVTKEMYNADLSDIAIDDLHKAELRKKNRKLSASLNKSANKK